MNSSPSLVSTMFRQRAQPSPPSRSKGWTTRHALTVTMVTVLLTWVMYHEAFPSKESSSSQVQGDQPNPVPRKAMKNAGVSLDTKPQDIDTEEVTGLPPKSDTGKHSTEEDATRTVTPSAGSLTNDVDEPSTEEGETTADKKIEDEVPHKSNDTSVQHDHGIEFAEVQNEQARVEQEESAEDLKATKAPEEFQKSESKNPNDNQENGDHLDAVDRLASLVDENEPENAKKEESSKEKLEDEPVKTLDSWSESIKESMEEGSHEDKLEEEPTQTVREQDNQSGEVTAPVESSQGNTGLKKVEDENEKQTEILVNDNAETLFSSEVQHEKEEELPIQDASSEVEQARSSDEKMEEKPEDSSHKPEQVEDGKDDVESQNFNLENHKADSKERQSAGETDVHESVSHEDTEARPNDAEELKGDEGEAWKDEEGERKAETQSDKQDTVESQKESTEEAKPEDENIVKVQEAVTETGTSGNVDGHDSEEKVEDVEDRKSEEKVENSDPQQNLEATFTYNTGKKEDEDSKAEPA